MIPYILLDFSGEVKGMTNWDMTMINDVLNGKVWRQWYEFFEVKKGDTEQNNCAGAIVIVPGRQNAGHEDKIQDYINTLDWCLLILVGDEERSFDYTSLKHDRMKVWLMQPKLDDKADFYLGSGYTPHTHEVLKQMSPQKRVDWFFAGQNNHPRRNEAVERLTRMLGRDDLSGSCLPTAGFTQGIDSSDYIAGLSDAKAVPCPSGIQSPDSFRVYEALEAGAVPIADDLSHVLVHEAGYWDKVFNDFGVPFKVYRNVDDLEGYICDVKREYPSYNNQIFSWWQQYKRFLVYKLNEHVKELSGLDQTQNKITVLILTSPIKSHPDTGIIEQTINDLRKVIDCEIIIGIDGIRPEQEHYRERYEEYQQRLLWKCNFEWDNVLPVRFDEHLHQAEMTRRLLPLVKTSNLLFVEHDTSLTPDYTFDWDRLTEAIETGQAYMIRFHFEAKIPDEHRHLMLNRTQEVCGLPMVKTIQWSQRPHLASTAFYKDMIDRYFNEQSRTMIEDVIHGKLIEAYEKDNLQGWYRWRVWIYTPEGNIKRSYTIDGRGEDPKYEMVF